MRRFPGIVAAAVALAGCQPRALSIDHGYVRLPAVAGGPAVAYFTIHTGATPATLIAVSSDTVIRSELHESMQQGSMATMRPLNRIAIGADEDVAFRPGGRHVMLFGVGRSVTPGGRMTLLLSFADGSRYEYFAPVIAAGAAAPE